MATKFKLPDFNTVQTEYKPRFKATYQVGLFQNSKQNPFKMQEVKSPSLFAPAKAPEVIEDEDATRISALEKQVANLTTRLEQAEGDKGDGRSAVEKMLNLPAGQVWWMDAFDIIDRPLRAVKEGLTDKSFKSAWEAFTGNRPGPFQEGYIEGTQFLVNMGIIPQAELDVMDPTQKLLYDIGVDILADPLTYTGPIKILQSLGILSKKKVITTLDEALKAARKAGLINATEEIVEKAIQNGSKGVLEALEAIFRRADGTLVDITEDALQKLAKDIIADPKNVAKYFDNPNYLTQVTDIAKKYSDDLVDAGIYNVDEFTELMAKLGQEFDPVTKKVVFTGKRKISKEMIDATSKIRKLVKTKSQTVDQVYNAAKAKITSIDKAVDAARALDPNVPLPPDLQQLLLQRADLDDYVKTMDALLQKAKDLGFKTSRGTELTFANILQPGEAAEMTGSEIARNLMEKKAKAVFGDNIIVLAGDSKVGGTDLAFFYRTESGRIAQLKTKKGLPFIFEIKDPARFSLENLSMRGVNDATVKAAKDAKDKAKALLATKRKGTKAYDKALKSYKKQYRRYLFETRMYRKAGGVPTFTLVDTQELVEKYGIKALDSMNESLRTLFKLRETMGDKWSISTYFDLLKKYDDVSKARINAARKTLKKGQKVNAAKIAAEVRDEIFTGKYKQYGATLTLKGGQTETVVRELLKVGEAANPKGAYGFVIQNAQGIDELVILNAEDFFKNINFIEFSFQSTQRSGGTSQKVVHNYFNVNIDKLDAVTKNNSWFLKELGIAAPSIKQTVEYTPGLIVRMLNGFTKTNIPFIAPTAEFIAKAVDGFTFLFNAKAGMSDELAEFLSKIPAEDIQAAKISVGRVKNIVDDIVRQTKGRYTKEFVEDVVQELIEQGWDGVSLAGRKMKVKEIFKRWVQEYSKAGTAMFSRLDDIQFRNFSSAIEDILRRNGLDPNLVKLTQREKFTLVEFADNIDKKALEEIADGLGLIGEEVLDIGKAPLTAKELAFAKEFNQPIQEIITETIGQQTILRELGFEFSRDMLGTGAYFRHAINPRMLAFLKKNSKAGTIKQFLDAGTDLLKDRLYIGSTREINAAVREMFGISIDLFSTDVYYNFADLVRVATTKNEMSKVLGTIIKEQDTLGRNLFEVLTDAEIRARGLTRQFNVLNGTFRQEFPNLFKNVSPQTQELLLKFFADKGLGDAGTKITIQKAAYGVLKRLDNAYVDLPAFVKSFDQYMKFWKTFALITPGYHMRNFFGNITNSYMVGMSLLDQSRYLFQSSWDFTRYKRVLKALQNGEDLKRFNQGTIDAFLRVDEYYRSGAAQSHRGVRDLEVIKEGLRQMRGQKRNVAQKVGDTLLNLNYTFAENADDFQRYALYRWAYKNADSSAAFRSAKKAGANKSHLEIIRQREAYKKVSEALFDYSHLTAFEKEYMKRLFPFYTFFKNNLILQAKTLFERPGQYAKLFRGYRYYTESMTGFEIEDLPNYMTDNLWLPMPYRVDKTDKEAIAWLRANLPPSDFTEFVENPFQRGVTSLTTPIKMFIELGTGRDLFTGRQIQEFPGELSQYEGEGVLQKFRDERGRLTLSQNPYAIKFLNDIGFRSILSYGSAGVDVVDYMGGTLTTKEMGARLLDALGITRVQELDKMEIAALYQNLDKLRDAKSLYDQENEGKLPTLAEIQAIAEQQEQQQGNPFANLFN